MSPRGGLTPEGSGPSGTGRHLEWPGCFNARDLGGLAAGPHLTRARALVRSDSLDQLTADGWAALWDHGVRTIIDLRNEDERGPDRVPRPDVVRTLNVPLDVSEDREFWNVWASGPQFGTPLYYWPHLERFPERSVAVLQAIAHAGPGGVLFHCGAGRDRAGQVTMLVLHLLGVSAETIAADYELSAARLRRRFEALAQPDQGPEIAAYLAERGTTAGELIVELLTANDVRGTLERGGLQDEDVDALRARALGRLTPKGPDPSAS